MGIKDYTIEEVIPIPKGIKPGTNIRLENKYKLIYYSLGKHE